MNVNALWTSSLAIKGQPRASRSVAKVCRLSWQRDKQLPETKNRVRKTNQERFNQRKTRQDLITARFTENSGC